VALSMEEQRILDEMERNLATEDPRLASRFNAFGQQRLPGAFTSQRARTISGLLALALIAAVTIVMFVLSPYGGHHSGRPQVKQSAASTAPVSGSANRTGTGS